MLRTVAEIFMVECVKIHKLTTELGPGEKRNFLGGIKGGKERGRRGREERRREGRERGREEERENWTNIPK